MPRMLPLRGQKLRTRPSASRHSLCRAKEFGVSRNIARDWWRGLHAFKFCPSDHPSPFGNRETGGRGWQGRAPPLTSI